MRSFKRHQGWRRALQYAVAAALLIVAPTAAQADFSGAYAPGNWTISAPTGSVDTSGAPASISITGGDLGPDSGTFTDFTIAAAGSGFWSFDFNWDNQDTDPFDDGPIFDFGGFIHNNVFAPYGGADTSGSQTPIAVNAGDIIGYRVDCTDCIFGPGVLTISNFSAPVGGVSIPEPGTLILMALGAAGLAVGRLRRRVK
jgi:hypothetical protein